MCAIRYFAYCRGFLVPQEMRSWQRIHHVVRGRWWSTVDAEYPQLKFTAPTIVLGSGVAHQHSPHDSRNELVRPRGCRGHQHSGVPTEFKGILLREQRPKAETDVKSGEERRMEKKRKRVMRKDLRRKLFWGS